MTSIGLADYFRTALDSSALAQANFTDENFALKVTDAIWDGLKRLDDLPREDRFWVGSNGKPTIQKLSDFCSYLLEDNPRDHRAIWTKAALALWHCTKDFGLPQWGMLFHIGQFDVNWTIQAAMHIELSTGAETSKRLAEFVSETRTRTAAQRVLQELQDSGSDTVAEWAASVLAALANVA